MLPATDLYPASFLTWDDKIDQREAIWLLLFIRRRMYQLNDQKKTTTDDLDEMLL